MLALATAAAVLCSLVIIDRLAPAAARSVAAAPVAAGPIIETVAGGVAPRGVATSTLMAPISVAVHGGYAYVADDWYHVVRRVDLATGRQEVIAGNGVDGTSGDGGPATSASLGRLTDITVDPAGSVYVSGEGRVRRIGTDGTITTVVGGGTARPTDGARGTDTHFGWFYADFGYAQDDGPTPAAIQAIGTDDILVSRSNAKSGDSWLKGEVWQARPDGTITRVAGRTGGPVADGGPAVDTALEWVTDLAVDAQGRVLVLNGTVRRFALGGTIATVAGGGSAVPGNGGPATAAKLDGATSIAVDADGDLLIGESPFNDPSRVRSVDPGGVIDALVDGVEPIALAAIAPGDLLIAQARELVRRKPDAPITRVAGADGYVTGDGGPALDAQLAPPPFYGSGVPTGTLVVDPDGGVHFSGSAGSGVIAAGQVQFDPPDTWPTLLGYDASGNRYEFGTGGVHEIAPDGTDLAVIPLTGCCDGVVAIAVSPFGDIYTSSGWYHCQPRWGCGGASRVDRYPNPTVGDRPPLPAIGGEFDISALAVDPAGNVVFVSGWCPLREFPDPCPQGIGYESSGGQRVSSLRAVAGPAAQLEPTGALTNAVAVDAGGTIYWARGPVVYREALGGPVEVVAGTGVPGFSGDGGPAADAQLGVIETLALGADGALYVWDGPRIRRIATTPAPSMPVGLTLTPNEGGVDATWQPPVLDGGAPIVAYEVTVTTTGVTSAPGDTPVEVPASQTSFAVTGLEPGTTVTVDVVARNADGARSLPAHASVAVGGPPTTTTTSATTPSTSITSTTTSTSSTSTSTTEPTTSTSTTDAPTTSTSAPRSTSTSTSRPTSTATASSTSTPSGTDPGPSVAGAAASPIAAAPLFAG